MSLGAGTASVRAAAGRSARSWLALGIAAVLVGLLVSFFVAGVVVVHGHSMEPTLHNGERVLVLRTGAWLHRFGLGSYRPGDIVFFPDPSRKETGLDRILGKHLLIKRIVAGPGDTVAMRAGELLVDGRPRPERYLAGAFRGVGSVPRIRIPPGHVFVMGDNRRPTASFDSRSFGPVAAGSIEGRAVLVIWPLVRRGRHGWRWNVRLLDEPAPPPVTGRAAAAR